MPGLTGFEVARRLADQPHDLAHHLRDGLRSACDRGVRGQRGRLPAEAGRPGAARGRRAAGRGGASRAICRWTISWKRSSSWSRSGRTGASGSPSRSANGFSSSRRRRSSTRRSPTTASPSSRRSTRGHRTTGRSTSCRRGSIRTSSGACIDRTWSTSTRSRRSSLGSAGTTSCG